MNIKRLLVHGEKYGLPALVAATFLFFVIAVIDLTQSQPQPANSVGGAITEVLTSDSDSSEGHLKIMHALLKVTLLWGAIRVYLAAAGLKWDQFVARYLSRGHVLIIAGGPASGDVNTGRASHPNAIKTVDKTAFAIDIASVLSRDHAVVLHVPDIDEGNRSRLWKAGVTLITGDYPTPHLLAIASVRRARTLLAMKNYFGENVSLVRTALSQCGQDSKLDCKCMIEPLATMRHFKAEDYFEDDKLPRVRVFNEAELVARRLLRDFPPDTPVALSNQGVHVLLIGTGSVGQAVLLQLARIGHYRSGKAPKVTVVSRDVKANWKDLLEAYPTIEKWIRVETEENRLENIGKADFDRWTNDEWPLTAVYVCTKDEIANLRIARMLLRELRSSDRKDQPVVPVIVTHPSGGHVLSDFAKDEQNSDDFHLFSLMAGNDGMADSAVHKNLLSDLDDSRASELHKGYFEKYVKPNLKPGEPPKKPTDVPWEYLPEYGRNSNRSSADHFEVKLRAIGCKLAPTGTAERAELTSEELDLIARMEHARWWADKSLDGWCFDTKRDDSKKRHHCMKDFDELEPEDKQKDIDSFNDMREIIEKEKDGFVVTRDK